MWRRDKKLCTMIQLNTTIEEFVDEVCKQVKFLCEHHYTKTSQAIYLENCKSTLPEDNALILLDFVNGTTAKQHSIPSLFKKKNQQSFTHESVCET